MAKKKYRVLSDDEKKIKDLIAIGAKVTATDWKLQSLEIDESKLNQVKTITGLDFEELKE